MLPCTDPKWGMPEGEWTVEQAREAMRRVALGCAEDWAQQAWLLMLGAVDQAPEGERAAWGEAAFKAYAAGLDPVVARIAADLELNEQGTKDLARDMAIVFNRHCEGMAARTSPIMGRA